MSRARRSAKLFSARLFTLQAKLVIAMTALIVLAVVATGSILVLRSKDERERQALDRVAATAPLVYQAIPAPFGGVAYSAGVVTTQPAEYGPNLDQLATSRDVRILLVGDQNVVIYDTGREGLQGFHVSYPPPDPEAMKRGFLAWQPPLPGPKGDLTFITPAPYGPYMTVRVPDGAGSQPTAAGQVVAGPVSIESGPSGMTEAVPATAIAGSVAPGTFSTAVGPPPPPSSGFGGPGRPYQVVLAVPSRDITDAWLSALPGVGIAGGIALPFAILAAVLIAGQVARPIHQLTLASEAMALGDFDQRVEVARSDEVGRLAQAFSTMAVRVGERDVQMRALVANVSHDLKTPMTSIMGYAQALQDGLIEPERVAHIAGVIRDQAATTNLLLADLLFLSEVDAGQTLPSTQDVAASQLATGAVERMQAYADQRGVSIALTTDDSVCAGVDAEKLTRALANVIDNAVRYSPEGGVVTIEASNAGDEVQVEVTNTGPLIAEEELSLIFDRFYRCDSATPGHGLGLAIAHEAVELSGGRIEARNTPTGVAVTITVPRRQGAA